MAVEPGSAGRGDPGVIRKRATDEEPGTKGNRRESGREDEAQGTAEKKKAEEPGRRRACGAMARPSAGEGRTRGTDEKKREYPTGAQ